jgi:hypothetical protein
MQTRLSRGGEQSVPRYQCYVLASDLHVAWETGFEAADNAEAFQKSRVVVNSQGLRHSLELRHGDHHVASDFDETVQPSLP